MSTKLERQAARREAVRLKPLDCRQCGIRHTTKDGHQACIRHITVRRSDGTYTVNAGRGCTKAPMQGQRLCSHHGGRTPAHRAAAARRINTDRAARVAFKWGLAIDTTPTEAILDNVKASAGHVRFYRLQVEALDANELVWGQTREKDGGDDRGSTYEAGRNAWLTLYDAERDRLVKFSAEAIKAGIEERRVRLAEQQGALVADAIRAILGELELTPKQAAKIPELVPRHLRLLLGGAA